MQRSEHPVLPEEKTDSVFSGESPLPAATGQPESSSVVIDGENCVGIRNVNVMPPFLMSIVGSGNLWLFAGSNSAFTAGRGNADHAILPYRAADKILSRPGRSGARSVFLLRWPCRNLEVGRFEHRQE